MRECRAGLRGAFHRIFKLLPRDSRRRALFFRDEKAGLPGPVLLSIRLLAPPKNERHQVRELGHGVSSTDQTFVISGRRTDAPPAAGLCRRHQCGRASRAARAAAARHRRSTRKLVGLRPLRPRRRSLSRRKRRTKRLCPVHRVRDECSSTSSCFSAWLAEP